MSLTPKWIDRRSLLDLGIFTLGRLITLVDTTLYLVAFRSLPREYRTVAGSVDLYGLGIYRSSNGTDWQGMDNGFNLTNQISGPTYIPGWSTPTDRFDNGQSMALVKSHDDATLYVIGTMTNGKFGMFPFTLSTERWGSFVDFTFTIDTSNWSDPYFFAGFRSNGDLLLAYQSTPTAFEAACVTVKKRVAGVWSTIATYDVGAGPEYDCNLCGGVIDDDDNLHLMFTRCITYDSTPGVYDLYHASVSADDVDSGFHMVYESISTDYNIEGYWGILQCRNNTLGFAFMPLYGDNYPANGEFRMAFGDLTADSLNPTWTTEEISNTHIPWPGGWDSWGAAYYENEQWSVLFKSRYPGAPNSSDAIRLWRITRTDGTWGTPELMYTPVDTTSAARLHLCNQFDTGIGVLFEDYDGGDKNLAYDGPNPSGAAAASQGCIYRAN